MRILFIVSALLIMPLSSIGQITLKVKDHIKAGDSVTISKLTPQSIDYSSTGANTTWDFSNLNTGKKSIERAHKISSAGFLIKLQFGSFAPSKYKANYFQSYDGLPIKQITDIIKFIPGAPNLPIDGMNRIVKIDGNKITYPGYSVDMLGSQVGIKSDKIEVGFVFPLSYKDTLYSEAKTIFSFAPLFKDIKIIQYRQRKSVVDGYGTVTTPAGKFDVLRIKHKIEEQDSVGIIMNSNMQWIPINRTLYKYEWWSKGLKRPVLRIETEKLVGNLEAVRSVTYLTKSNLGIEKQNTIETKLYPNPTTDFVHIKTNELIEKVVLYNIIGEKVFTKNYNSKDINIDVNHLSSGIYTLQILTKNNTAVRSVVIN